jgi:hypothetical protein
MNRSPKTVLARTAFVAAVFVAGYFAGSAGQPVAEAQLGDALKAAGAAAAASAGGTGGVLGTAAKLGTSITEMQQSVDTLQRNIEVLQSIKASIGG